MIDSSRVSHPVRVRRTVDNVANGRRYVGRLPDPDQIHFNSVISLSQNYETT
jgi:hypothetical protein